MNPILPTEQLILLMLVIAGVGGWSAWRSAARCTGLVRAVILGLRVVSICALATIAFNPGYWQAQRRDDTREWAVLVDSSASMNTPDLDGQARWSQATKISRQLHAAGKEMPALKFFSFDSELRAENSAAKPSGRQSDLIGAGNQLLDRFRNLGGIIVVTDGRQVPPRSSADFELKARTLQTPVYPLVLGKAVASQDLTLSTARRQYVGFKEQPLKVLAKITNRGYTNVQPRLTLLDESGRALQEKQVTIRDEATIEAALEIKPASDGYSRYKIRLEPMPGENIAANNETEFGVFALKGKARILLLEGTPYWDSKFIAQLLQKHGQFDATVIYRLTQQKYFSLSSTGALADQAVIKTFPETAQALGQYDLVIAGKGLEYFLNPEQVNLLKDFVRERGGGLLFARGKPYSGQWPDLEPLEPILWDQEWTGDFQWQPTSAGEEAGLFGERLPGKDNPIWAKLPPLSRASQGTRTKTFARVLAEGVAKSGERTRRIPVVVSQQYGNGLIVTINSDDLWQWDFFPKFEGASALYQDFWVELLHWAIMHSEYLPGNDWSLRLSEQTLSVGQQLRARVTTRATNAPALHPILRVMSGSDVVCEAPLTALPNQPSQWESIFAVDRAGTFRVELSTGAQPLLIETLTVKAPPQEEDDLSADSAAMTALAAQTEGRVVTEKDLAELLKSSIKPPAPLENMQWHSAWDRSFCLLAIAAALGAEWFLRRRNGLT